MTKQLKTLTVVCYLMTALSLIRTTIIHFDQKRIVKIIDQTHVVEPLTVTDTAVTDSRLSVSLGNVGIFGSRGYNEDDIQGELGVRYVLNNDDTYDDYVNMQDVRDNRVPGVGSILTKAYYKGTYKLRSGKTVTLTTRRKLKLGKVTHGSAEPVYEWRRIAPNQEPLTVSVRVSYSTSTGKSRVNHSYTDTVTLAH